MTLERVKGWAKRTLAPSVRYATRQGARVLMYHRFGDDDAGRGLPVDLLEKQLDHLRRHFHVVPLRELVARLKSGRDPEPYSVALTVDDAYADFGALGYPVFLRHRVPVTLYVVSELASGRLWLWWDAIRYVLDHAPEGRYEVGARTVSLSDVSSRRAAWEPLADLGLSQTPDERDGYLADLQRLFGIDLPYPPSPEFAAMSWDELAALDSGLVEIGAHSRTHPILSHCDPERVTGEIAGSKAEIEERLGREVRSFCYPNGTWSDVNVHCFRAVREAGYESAVMSCGPLIRRGANVHALPRMSTNRTWDLFLGEVSGFRQLGAR
jgi:peptidoglycan/xylan/chitin deacetylase (PgdA/CDA1 family)